MNLKLIALVLLLSNTIVVRSQEKTLNIEDEVYYYVEKEYVKYYNDDNDQIYLRGMLGKYYSKSCGYDKYGTKKKGEYYNKNCNSATRKLIEEFVNFQIYDKALSTGRPIDGGRGNYFDRYEGEFSIEGAGSSGVWTYYHKNGNIKEQGELKNLKRVGKWIANYTNGNKKSEKYHIVESEPFRRSILEGESKWWYNSPDQLQVVYLNKKGERVKIESFYSKEGVQLIENGIGTYKIYGKSDQLEFSVDYKNGQRDGLATWYYSNGKVSSRAKYKSGGENHTGLRWEVLEGFDIEGHTLNMGTLKEGNGTWISYDENGKRQSMNTFENGVKVN